MKKSLTQCFPRRVKRKMSQNPSQNPIQNPRPGDVVENQKLKKPGLLIQKTIHDGYYKVISEGKIKEWHISNIYLISERIGE